jgi:hypothetical protein
MLGKTRYPNEPVTEPAEISARCLAVVTTMNPWSDLPEMDVNFVATNNDQQSLPTTSALTGRTQVSS